MEKKRQQQEHQKNNTQNLRQDSVCKKIITNLAPLLPPAVRLDAVLAEEEIPQPRLPTVVGYETSELESVPQASILGVGCGAPVKFADLQKGETVVDLGSGGGIDVFLSANKVSNTGKVIGIDMTDEMLERARRNAKEGRLHQRGV